MTVRFSVTVRQVREDGSEAPLDGELAAALAAPAEQFAGLAAWAADEAGFLRSRGAGEGDRRRRAASCSGGCCRPRSTSTPPARSGPRGSPAPPGSGTAAWKKATAGAWPACSGRSGSPGWPTATAASRTCTPPTPGRSCPATRTPWGCGPWRPSTWPRGGFGQAQEVIEARTGVTVGRAQLTGLAEDLAAWTDDFYERARPRRGREDQPDSDVIMMQADGKGIAMRPEHRKNAGKADGTRTPGSRRWPRSSPSPTSPPPSASRRTSPPRPPAARRTPARRPGTSGYRPRSPRASRT